MICLHLWGQSHCQHETGSEQVFGALAIANRHHRLSLPKHRRALCGSIAKHNIHLKTMAPQRPDSPLGPLGARMLFFLKVISCLLISVFV